MPKNELDLLMDEDPELLSDRQIDEIVAYLRKTRMATEFGVKPKKAVKDGMVKLDDLVASITQAEPAQKEKRRG